MKDKLIWIVVNTCRLLVSAIFIFSGLVKLIDPHGTEYKIQDYLIAMHLDGWFNIGFIPLVIAVFLAILEFCLGVYLLFSIRRRTTISLILLLMVFYTPLTLWLAISDAVADCGCFGDAWHLTNWQTFGKNVLVAAMTVPLWFQRRRLTRLISEAAQWIISIAAICGGLLLASESLYYEPLVDFRPFHVGQHIPSAMQWTDNPNEQPEILDFYWEQLPFAAAASSSVPDVEEVLADTSYTFLLTMPHLETSNDTHMDQINAIYDYACLRGYLFLALTPSDEAAIVRWRDLTGAAYNFAFMDELTLKTIARSNPAIVLIHNGTIIGKWGHRQLPSEEELMELEASER